MAWVAWFSWKNRRSTPGSFTYMWFSGLTGLISIFDLFVMLSPSARSAGIWFSLRFFCLANAPVLWLIFVLRYSGKDRVLSRRMLLLIFVIPAVTQVMIWTNGLHHLWTLRDVIFHQAGPFLFPDPSARIAGPWMKVHFLYSYTITLIGMVYLVAAASGMYRRERGQAILLITGILVIVAGSLFPSFSLIPGARMSPMPQFTAAGSLVIAAGINLRRFLSEIPRINQDKKVHKNLLILFVIMSAGIIGAGYTNYIQYSNYHRTQAEKQLLDIADLKVSQIVQWRTGRLGDGEILGSNTAFISLAERFLSSGDPDAGSMLRSWLGLVQSSKSYRQIVLLDRRGLKRMTLPGQSPAGCADENLDVYLARAVKEGRPVLTDIHKNNTDGFIHLSVIVPLQRNKASGVCGYVVLVIDPGIFLYPILVNWPSPESTAETNIVRREGDGIVLLNDKRFIEGTALDTGQPLTNTNHPAVMAVLGKEGIVEAVDRRGTNVIAALKKIPDSGWYLVAKIDIREVYGPVRERFWIMVLVMTGFIGGTAAGIRLIWRRRSDDFYREQYEAAEALRVNERKLREAQELAHLGYWRWNVKTGDVEWSDEVYRIFGLDPASFRPHIDSILAMSPWPGDNQRNTELISIAMADRSPGSYEQKILRPDNTIGYYYSTFQGNYDDSGSLTEIVGTVMDITGRKHAEEALMKSLNEKKELIREIYHRTKNNMQVIISMLALQNVFTGDEKLGGIFREMENRIRAMALVHEKLYQSRELSRINAGEYLGELTDAILSGYGITPDKIKVTRKLQDVLMLIDTAIPCGLVVNELVTNVARHAFPGDRIGELVIELSSDAGECISLVVSDNGVGAGIEAEPGSTFGLMVVKNVVEYQLKGTVTMDTSAGICWRITFRDNAYEERI